MSLYDIFLTRAAMEHQNALNEDTGEQLLLSLSKGVLEGIEQEKNRKLEQEKMTQAITMANKLGADNKSKITTKLKIGDSDVTIQSGDDDLSKEKFKLEVQSELRRAEQEERRLTDQTMAQINSYGRTINPDDTIDTKAVESLGIDMDQLLEEGTAKRTKDGVYIYPDARRKEIISQKEIPQTVADAVAEFKDTKDIMRDAVAEFKDLGLDKYKVGWDIFQQLFNPVGPLSLQAKSDLLRQLNDANPRLANLHSKLERAFQKYRIPTTGVQASDKELRVLRPLISNLSQNPEVFLLSAEEIAKELDQSVNNRIGVARSIGRDEERIKKLESFYFGDTTPRIGLENISISPKGKAAWAADKEARYQEWLKNRGK